MWFSRVIKADLLHVKGVRRIRREEVLEGKDGLLGVANHEATSLLEEVREEAIRLLDEARRQANEERKVGYMEGYREGYASGRAQTEEILKEARQLREETLKDRESLYAAMGAEIVDLIFAISRKVIGGELASRPEAVLDLVVASIRETGDASQVTVTLSPQAAGILAENEGKLRQRVSGMAVLEIREDSSLGDGCLVESPEAMVDARVDGQLALLRTAFQEDPVIHPGIGEGEQGCGG